MEIKTCIKCKQRPVFIKKRQLCAACYQREYKKAGSFIAPEHDYCGPTLANHKHNNEVEFIKNFFDHNDWIYQPATFRINGDRYTPDFYDSKRNVFIEVAGTKQAFHQNKKKYKLFKKHYPLIKFEIRITSGSLLKDMPRGEMWQNKVNGTNGEK